MSVKINASTSSGLVVDSDLTGSLQLQTGGNPAISIDSSQVTNFAKQFQIGGVLPPAFSAYRSSSNQSITTNTWTALSAQTEEYDTASCYNNTGSTVGSIPAYSFLPNVAGYYQISGEINTTVTSGSQANIAIYKNGSEFKRGFAIVGGSFTQYCMPVSALIYLNGTTDYVTLYGVVIGTSPVYVSAGNGEWCYFQGVLARAA